MRANKLGCFLALAVLGTVVGGGLLSAVADAATATSATLTMTSDPGDYIGQGASYSYSTAENDVFTADGTTGNNAVAINLESADGDFWTLDFAAPTGQALAPGTYDNANRYPFQGSGPGLAIYGEGRGCNMDNGSFTVTKAKFGPDGYVTSFDASFVQHCEGETPALQGTIDLVDPPAPPLLHVGITPAVDGKLHYVAGTATVSGTVTCNEPVSVNINGTLDQRANRFSLATGSFNIQVACSTTPTTWQFTVSPSATVPFNVGAAQLSVTAFAFDPNYQQNVSVTRTVIVHLAR